MAEPVGLMQAPEDKPLTVEAWEKLDAESEFPVEYWGGIPIRMEGESINHNHVKDNIHGALKQRLDSCTVRQSGLRVYAPDYGKVNYAYPDVIVVCGEMQFEESTNPPVLLNPTLLIEITSESTEMRDIKEKFDAYMKIESLVSYWIIDPNQPYARCHEPHINSDTIITRICQNDNFILRSVPLSLGIPASEVYAGLAWFENA